MERANQEVITVLRKLSDEDPTNWHLQLPFVVLAHNMKLHSVTKVSPYHLVFGKENNRFLDWKATNDEETELHLYRRIKQLKHNSENTIPLAIENSESAKSNQRYLQDKDAKVRIF